MPNCDSTLSKQWSRVVGSTRSSYPRSPTGCCRSTCRRPESLRPIGFPNTHHLDEALIVAVAESAAMTIATRNSKHLEPLGVPCLTPWDTTAPRDWAIPRALGLEGGHERGTRPARRACQVLHQEASSALAGAAGRCAMPEPAEALNRPGPPLEVRHERAACRVRSMLRRSTRPHRSTKPHRSTATRCSASTAPPSSSELAAPPCPAPSNASESRPKWASRKRLHGADPATRRLSRTRHPTGTPASRPASSMLTSD